MSGERYAQSLLVRTLLQDVLGSRHIREHCQSRAERGQRDGLEEEPISTRVERMRLWNGLDILDRCVVDLLEWTYASVGFRAVRLYIAVHCCTEEAARGHSHHTLSITLRSGCWG